MYCPVSSVRICYSPLMVKLYVWYPRYYRKMGKVVLLASTSSQSISSHGIPISQWYILLHGKLWCRETWNYTSQLPHLMRREPWWARTRSAASLPPPPPAALQAPCCPNVAAAKFSSYAFNILFAEHSRHCCRTCTEDGPMDRQTDRQTNGQMDGWTDRQTETDGQKDRQMTDRQTDKWTDGWTDRQTDG